MKKTIYSLLLMLLPLNALAQAIGGWNAYPGYDNITSIEIGADGNVFCLSQGNLFCYNENDNTVTPITKMNYLNDCSIVLIQWVQAAGKLMVVYENGNMDFIDKNFNVVNLSAYSQHIMAMDKTVNSLFVDGSIVYMATAFGVVKIDADKVYIVDTYNFGLNMRSVVKKGDYIYASCDEGIKRGLTTKNLLDISLWENVNSSNWEYVIMAGNDILFANKSGLMTFYDSDKNTSSSLSERSQFSSFSIMDGKLLLYGGSKSYVFSSAENKTTIDRSFTAIALKGNNFYVGKDDKLVSADINMETGQVEEKMEGVRPDGPHTPYAGFLRYENGKLLIGTGLSSSTRQGALEIKIGDEWIVEESDLSPFPTTKYSFSYCAQEDPKEADHFMVAANSGLYEYRGGKLVNLYNLDNSPLKYMSEYSGSKLRNYVIVSGLVYNADGKLWLMNGDVEGQSLFSFENGEFTSHHNKAFTMDNNISMVQLSSMFFDSRGLLWMGNNNHKETSLVRYNADTDEAHRIKTFVNQDGTKVDVWYCRCVKEDKEGNIWIGTDAGPLMLQAESIKNEEDFFQQVKVPRNDGTNLADYLLSGEDVTSIYIDKANRKWFGTDGSGIYVISPDNITEIYHFTSTNSNLLSDNIESLELDPVTGEMYIGTDKGLCSYQTDICALTSDGGMTGEKAWAYPNPVTPDFNGKVTICGLEYDADVKIVTSSGTLVHSGRSQGGTYKWDCCDQRGQRVASGVYMVMTATALGGKGMVCKIAIVN